MFFMLILGSDNFFKLFIINLVRLLNSLGRFSGGVFGLFFKENWKLKLMLLEIIKFIKLIIL